MNKRIFLGLLLISPIVIFIITLLGLLLYTDWVVVVIGTLIVIVFIAGIKGIMILGEECAKREVKK